MRLHLHPDSRCDAIAAIDAELEWAGSGQLRLRYVLSGEVGAVRIPTPAPPGRADGLWRTTCFEAFVGWEGGGYEEFNFSPSGRWAAYRFAGYRSGMAKADLQPPLIESRISSQRFELNAELRPIRRSRCRIGLSAIVEEADGARSYWALAHPPGPPDFHHPNCFALELPPAASGS